MIRVLRKRGGLTAQTDETGRVLLGGTLSKSYLPKEKVGKPGKWVTFYVELAKAERGNQ